MDYNIIYNQNISEATKVNIDTHIGFIMEYFYKKLYSLDLTKNNIEKEFINIIKEMGCMSPYIVEDKLTIRYNKYASIVIDAKKRILREIVLKKILLNE